VNLPAKEKHVLNACLALLAARGWPHWRNNVGAARYGGQLVKFGIRGMSDIVAIVPRSGRFLAVECKRPDGRGRLTDEQLAFLASVQRAGGVAVVVADVLDLAGLLDALEVDPWHHRVSIPL
jgi:hypothetical protein